MAARTLRVAGILAYLAEAVPPAERPALEALLGPWFDRSKRFVAFAEAHRDKIRRKLRTATEPGARDDVLAELETAFRLLDDRRIELAFEAYGSGRRGPDFTVTFRAAHRFNLEVTRPRMSGESVDPEALIGRAVLAKVRQFPTGVANALLIATPVAQSPDQVALTMRTLKQRADGGDGAYFSARGMALDEFQAHHRRMSALFVAGETAPGVFAWLNPEARLSLPDGAANACLARLGGTARSGQEAVGSETG